MNITTLQGPAKVDFGGVTHRIPDGHIAELRVSESPSEDDESDLFQLLDLLADIRAACGDNGQRMQPEMVRYIGDLRKKAELWDAHRASGKGA